jgi:hypothetical protein
MGSQVLGTGSNNISGLNRDKSTIGVSDEAVVSGGVSEGSDGSNAMSGEMLSLGLEDSRCLLGGNGTVGISDELTGITVGSVVSTVPGSLVGTVPGSVPGSVVTVPGSVVSTVPGSLVGTVPGSVVTVPGSVVGSTVPGSVVASTVPGSVVESVVGTVPVGSISLSLGGKVGGLGSLDLKGLGRSYGTIGILDELNGGSRGHDSEKNLQLRWGNFQTKNFGLFGPILLKNDNYNFIL